MNLRHFEVGKLFEPGKTHYKEAVKFEFTKAGPVLLLFFDAPTPKEIDSVAGGDLRIGFDEKNEIIFLLLKFEGMPWMDAPYSIHLSPPVDLAEVEEGTGYGLQIFLVDSSTGILKAMRIIGLGTEWSRRFKEAVERQRETAFDAGIYDAKIQNIYRSFTPKDLAETVPLKNWFRIRRS